MSIAAKPCSGGERWDASTWPITRTWDAIVRSRSFRKRVWQTDLEYGKRFVSEGRTAAALVHPNIVTTHAIGEARGYRFLELEFVPGRSLQELIEHEQRLVPSHAMSLILRIAEGLAAAHRKGIIHRDLKPDNVLVSVQSVPKIADFGLAKRVWSERDEGELLVGTPHYMAPELFNGDPATAASDVYALGACLFVMLTGQVPYPCGSIQALAERVQGESLPDFRQLGVEVPLEIADCIDQLMSKTPANRPSDAGEALQLLTAVAGDVPDVESLLATAFGSQPNVTWSRCGEKFCVEVRLPEGRRQTVLIEPSAIRSRTGCCCSTANAATLVRNILRRGCDSTPSWRTGDLPSGRLRELPNSS